MSALVPREERPGYQLWILSRWVGWSARTPAQWHSLGAEGKATWGRRAAALAMREASEWQAWGKRVRLRDGFTEDAKASERMAEDSICSATRARHTADARRYWAIRAVHLLPR